MPLATPNPADLPLPSAELLAHSACLESRIRARIDAAGGCLPFDRFMEMVLYEPGLGYYVSGLRKFGAAGDFITAPETSTLFGACLARQYQPILSRIHGADILEFGAGSGALAAQTLAELERLGSLPDRYLILDISPELRSRQRATLEKQVPHLSSRVDWLDRLPEPGFRGIAVANELLDAMPVHRFRITDRGLAEICVTADEQGLRCTTTEPGPDLAGAVQTLRQHCAPLAPDYESEINLRLPPWLANLGSILEQGLILLIDYGYPCQEYYHPQRDRGTLMCHYRHRAHDDPLRLIGLQDITAQVDFSAAARAGTGAGLELAGYTTQAHFLLGCGLDKLVADSDPNDLARHLALMQEVKRLTLPSEMGERFKVLGLTRNIAFPLQGFALNDLRNRL